MYVLLEHGMKIECYDQAFDEECWGSVELAQGSIYSVSHVPMRREINTIKELGDFLKETNENTKNSMD